MLGKTVFVALAEAGASPVTREMQQMAPTRGDTVLRKRPLALRVMIHTV